MRAKALRLPDRILDIARFAEKRDKTDEPTILRKFLSLGAEQYVARCYARGEVSLREAAAVLAVSSRQALELFWDMGISGNVGAEETVRALSTLEKLS